jgi:hypothetical protein
MSDLKTEANDLNDLNALLIPIIDETSLRDQQKKRNFALIIEVVEVNANDFVAMLRDGVDLSFSYRFKGVIDGQMQAFSSYHEATLDLVSDPFKFTRAFLSGVLDSNYIASSENFMIFIEVFDTKNDPNWSRPLIEIGVHSAVISVKDFI